MSTEKDIYNFRQVNKNYSYSESHSDTDDDHLSDKVTYKNKGTAFPTKKGSGSTNTTSATHTKPKQKQDYDPSRLDKEGNKIVRPPNAWILYRSAKFAELRSKTGDRRTQASLSKEIAHAWKNESAQVKFQYEQEAQLKKSEHERMYPDYKYQPRKGHKQDKSNINNTTAKTNKQNNFIVKNTKQKRPNKSKSRHRRTKPASSAKHSRTRRFDYTSSDTDSESSTFYQKRHVGCQDMPDKVRVEQEEEEEEGKLIQTPTPTSSPIHYPHQNPTISFTVTNVDEQDPPTDIMSDGDDEVDKVDKVEAEKPSVDDCHMMHVQSRRASTCPPPIEDSLAKYNDYYQKQNDSSDSSLVLSESLNIILPPGSRKPSLTVDSDTIWRRPSFPMNQHQLHAPPPDKPAATPPHFPMVYPQDQDEHDIVGRRRSRTVSEIPVAEDNMVNDSTFSPYNLGRGLESFYAAAGYPKVTSTPMFLAPSDILLDSHAGGMDNFCIDPRSAMASPDDFELGNCSSYFLADSDQPIHVPKFFQQTLLQFYTPPSSSNYSQRRRLSHMYAPPASSSKSTFNDGIQSYQFP